MIYATVIGGFEWRKSIPRLKTYVDTLRKHTNDTEAVIRTVNSSNDGNHIYPMEPDLIGEFFVLYSLNGFTFEYIEMLWEYPEKMKAFLFRCIDDFISSQEEHEGFDDVFSELLFPSYVLNNYPEQVAEVITYLIERQSATKIESSITILEKILKFFPNDANLALSYAKSLFKSSDETDVNNAKIIAQKLKNLSEQFEDNNEIANWCELGFRFLAFKQTPEEAEVTVEEINNLAKRFPSDNILLFNYADTL